MNIYTAQYRYNGPDRVDVTAKASKGVARLFAPTWGLINNLRNKVITDTEYEWQYRKNLNSMAKSTNMYQDVKSLAVDDELTLVCFCAPGAFCHRVILAKWLEEQGVGTYCGERSE